MNASGEPARAARTPKVELALSEAALETIARRAAEIVLGDLQDLLDSAQTSSPYLTVAETADFLRSSRQRVYDLLSERKLTRVKDGARVLVRRDELLAYLESGHG
jgi:excisionase family DNA binding protein